MPAFPNRVTLGRTHLSVCQTPEGERAATVIREFVRRRLPCGSPDSYTRAELDAFAKSHLDRLRIPPDDCPAGP
jgi:hypothetical protein